MKNEKIIIFALLLVSVASFFAFGFFHLTKFETTDEHLWKFGRIKQYWQAIGNKDWEKTYINDKPGITVALVSGIGLLSHPQPELQRNDITQTESMNFAFRFPILIFASLSLFLFFWFIWKAFDSMWLSLFSVLFIALNPILVGMSQIINPDSFFWIFGGLSIFSYLAYLNKKEKKFLILCAIVTGFALLSKYTSFSLFVFYFLALVSKLIFRDPEKEKIDNALIFKQVGEVALIFVISILTFSILLPAVLVDPKLLFKGISQFLSKDLWWVGLILAAIIGLFVYKKNLLTSIFDYLARKKKLLVAIVVSVFLLITALLLIDVWTGQKIVPLDTLRDAAYANEPKNFNFGKLLSGNGIIEKNFKLALMEFYPFIFSLFPWVLVLIIFFSARVFTKKMSDFSYFSIFTCLLFFLFYFASTLFAEVVTNVRYSIVIYPLFAFLSAAALIEILDFFKSKNIKFLTISAVAISLLGIWSLFAIRPFYFSYENSLLPKKYTVNSSWGHGFYEAAQYLNSKPNAEKLVIYSNSATICPFFKGTCLKSRKINLDIVKPDYFIISKRGAIKKANRFIFTNPNYQGKSADWYFDNLKTNYEWSLFLGDRQENYVKIVKFEK